MKGALFALSAGAAAGLLALMGIVTTPLLPVAAIVGVGVFVLGVVRPAWAVYLAILLIPLETASASFTGFGLTPTELVLVTAAAGWLTRRLLKGGGSVSSSLTLPLFAVLLAHVPGLFLAVDRFVVIKELFMWSACFVLFLAMLADQDRHTTERLAGVIAASAAAVAVIAVAKTAGSQQVALQAGGIVTNRATGSFASPVLLAAFLVITLPVQLVFIAIGRSTAVRMAGLAATCLSLLALTLALTRTAYLSLAILAVWLMVAWKPARRLALVAIVLFSAGLLTGFNPAGSVFNPGLLVQRISSIGSTESDSASLRLQTWKAAPKMIEDNLPFGVGAKNFPRHAPDYGLVFDVGVPSNAHNTPLVIASEFGVPGLIAVAWLVIAICRALTRSLRLTGEPEHSLAVALTGVFLALAVDAMTDYEYGDNAFFLTLILLAALVARLERVATVTEPAPQPVVPAGRKLALA